MKTEICVMAGLLMALAAPMLQAADQSEGPYFYMNSPAGGRFTIDPEYNGEKQTRTKDLVGCRDLVPEFKFHAK